jgi:hypothetical protein
VNRFLTRLARAGFGDGRLERADECDDGDLGLARGKRGDDGDLGLARGKRGDDGDLGLARSRDASKGAGEGTRDGEGSGEGDHAGVGPNRARFGVGPGEAPGAPVVAPRPNDVAASGEPPRAALLTDLRQRIDRLERRPAAERARLPPMPIVTGRRRAPLALDGLPGAARAEDGVVVVRSVLGAAARVGRVAPAECVVAHPDVAAPLAGLPAPAPRELLHGLRLLDIETTGLAGGTGTLAFLVGVAWFEPDGALVIEQLVLESPAEEEALLVRLGESLRGATLLVTFNGKSFDAPLLRTRCVLRRQAPGALRTAPHLDVLAVARRLWKHRVCDCRLVTLEEQVLRRRRTDDVPGAMAPAAFSEFLQTGDASALGPIVVHNRLDLEGSAALLAAALRTYEAPLEWAEDPAEILAVAEHRTGLGDHEGALGLMERALEFASAGETRRRAMTQLARLYRRLGRPACARAIWERYRREFPAENLGYVELAKHLEHRERDPQAALTVALAAPHRAAFGLDRRIDRLRGRTERTARAGAAVSAAADGPALAPLFARLPP